MDFIYTFALKLAYPTSLCAILLLLAVVFHKRPRLSRGCAWAALAILLVCGNGWVVQGLVTSLERQHQPLPTIPSADCILVLSGGLKTKIPPRPTIEVGEAGDRLLYAARLYREGKSRRVVCTGDKSPGSAVLRPIAEDMAEFLQFLGVPVESILVEKGSQNTHQHALNLAPLFQERGIKRVLLVTSAAHMPRSLGVFRHSCPGIEFIPAPTDFQVTEPLPGPWYRFLVLLVPTPSRFVEFSEAMHEWGGIAYYRLRGWM